MKLLLPWLHLLAIQQLSKVKKIAKQEFTQANGKLAAAGKFIELSIKEPDNNVKLIVLDRVDQLRKKHEGVLDDLTMEILRVLSRYLLLSAKCKVAETYFHLAQI